MRVLIIGAGGHAKVVADVIKAESLHEVEGFIGPDGTGQAGGFMGHAIIGDDDRAEKMLAEATLGAIIGVGDIDLRRKLLRRFSRAESTWINAVHPRSYLSETVILGNGVVVMAGAVINPMASISDHVIINTNVSIDHDCVIGENVHVAPGVAMGGSCRVGKDTLVGIGARLIPGISIGSGCVIGAGSVVVGDVPDGATVVGSPARPIRRSHEAG